MGSSGKDAVRDAKNAANKQMAQMRKEQGVAKAAVEKQKQAYKSFEFENVYADMENTFEDMTVNQQQAQFQAQQGAQQRSNIMETMRGAAGGSGIAGLAQAMAGQGQLATQQASASIGAQESQQQMAKAQGAASIDLQQRQGEAMVQQAESGREATLLGMEYGGLQAAQAGVQGAYGAQQSAAAMELERVNANKALTGQIIGGVVGAAGAVVGGALAGKKG